MSADARLIRSSELKVDTSGAHRGVQPDPTLGRTATTATKDIAASQRYRGPGAGRHGHLRGRTARDRRKPAGARTWAETGKAALHSGAQSAGPNDMLLGLRYVAPVRPSPGQLGTEESEIEVELLGGDPVPMAQLSHATFEQHERHAHSFVLGFSEATGAW